MKKIYAATLAFCIGSAAMAPQSNAQAPATPPQPTAQQPAASAPAASAQLPGNIGARNNSYSDRIPAEQIVELDAAGDKFLARHTPDLSGQPRGAAIILHDSAQNPVWPFTAAALSDDLPLHGWDTLSIELPAPDAATAATAAPPATPAATTTPPPAPAPAAAPATAAPGTAAASSPAATPTAIEPRVQARLAVALKYYSDQQIKNVVLIGFGSGSIRSAEFLRTYAAGNAGKFEPISALVMVMPLQKLNGIETDLPKILPTTTAPALDLILASDMQVRAEAEARRRAVLHQRERIYRQLNLPPINSASDPQHNLMVKRVRAWLQQNATAQAQPETEKK